MGKKGLTSSHLQNAVLVNCTCSMKLAELLGATFSEKCRSHCPLHHLDRDPLLTWLSPLSVVPWYLHYSWHYLNVISYTERLSCLYSVFSCSNFIFVDVHSTVISNRLDDHSRICACLADVILSGFHSVRLPLKTFIWKKWKKNLKFKLTHKNTSWYISPSHVTIQILLFLWSSVGFYFHLLSPF